MFIEKTARVTSIEYAVVARTPKAGVPDDLHVMRLTVHGPGVKQLLNAPKDKRSSGGGS